MRPMDTTRTRARRRTALIYGGLATLGLFVPAGWARAQVRDPAPPPARMLPAPRGLVAEAQVVSTPSFGRVFHRLISDRQVRAEMRNDRPMGPPPPEEPGS